MFHLYLLSPVSTAPSKFDSDAFVAACAAFPRAPLSLGWTTAQPPAGSEGTIGYTEENVDEMLAVCARAALLDRNVTFPVRACMALATPAPLRRLLNAASHSASACFSLTVWHGAEGCTRAQRNAVLSEFGCSTFVDVTFTDE